MRSFLIAIACVACISSEPEYSADMSLKLHYGVQYVGDYLMAGSFAGNRIARNTFEANFINDISESLEISASRIQVLSIERGKVHHSWENVISTFRSVAGGGSWQAMSPHDAKRTTSKGIYLDFMHNHTGSESATRTGVVTEWNGGRDEFGGKGLGEGPTPPYALPQKTPNVIVEFRIYNRSFAQQGLYERRQHHATEKSTVLAVRDLTAQVQNSTSRLYDGHVTFKTLPDSTWGTKVKDWDSSIKLTYALSVIGELNSVNRRHFEHYFVNDIARAVGITATRVQVLFITPGDRDVAHHGSSVVKFRMYPPETSSLSEPTVEQAYFNLTQQLMDVNRSSLLYSGNVTMRSDSAYGLAGPWGMMRRNQTARKYGPLGYDVRNTTGPSWSLGGDMPDDGAGKATEYRNRGFTNDAYERCKSTHRCARAWAAYHVQAAEMNFTYQSFIGGVHKPAVLFSEFENWRSGTHGWTYSAEAPMNRSLPVSQWMLRGAHYSTFNFALNPYMRSDVSGTLHTRGWDVTDSWASGLFEVGREGRYPNLPRTGLVLDNKGLVLDLDRKLTEVAGRQRIINELTDEIDFLTKAIVTARDGINGDYLGKHPKSGLPSYQHNNPHNYDRIRMRYKLDQKRDLRALEVRQRQDLLDSQCNHTDCTLLFNTSSNPPTLVGAIVATGIISTTAAGTEAAVFNFDSIDIGPGVNVTIIGHRAFVLLSRSSIIMNTTLFSYPGSVGGFPGGSEISHNDFAWEHTTPDVSSTAGYPGYGNTSEWMKRLGDGAEVDTKYWRNFLGVHSSAKNNVNGPGSGSVRVYQHVVTSSGTDVDEIQTVTTGVNVNQTLSGGFKLTFTGHCHRDVWAKCTFPNETTAWIPHDASAELVKERLEQGIRRLGIVSVTRTPRTAWDSSVGQGGKKHASGYTWSITFQTAVGNQQQLTATNYLTGIGAWVNTSTPQDGNSVMGSFSIDMLGKTTRPMPYNIEASDMEKVLKADIPAILDAYVIRSDPTALCDHGLCDNGPDEAGGYIWTTTVTTQTGNISPHSPTSTAYTTMGQIERMTATFNGSPPRTGSLWNISNSSFPAGAQLTGVNAAITITEGHWKSRIEHLANMNYAVDIPYGMGLTPEATSYVRNIMSTKNPACRAISSAVTDAWCDQQCGDRVTYRGGSSETASSSGTQCPKILCRCDGTHNRTDIPNVHVFSMAFGGAGGSYGGRGGIGHGKNAPGFIYNDDEQTDLLGGSGGAAGGERAFEIRPHPDPMGKGGAGGGAIELVAVNDITIGNFGRISVDGEQGHNGHRAGGGGSGGAVLLVAGGAVVHDGVITANGGAGGAGQGDGAKGAGSRTSRSGGGAGGGRVAMYANSVQIGDRSKNIRYNSLGMIEVRGGLGGSCSSPTCSGPGQDGSIHVPSVVGGGHKFMVDITQGAAGTNKSLLITGTETGRTASGVSRLYPRMQHGKSTFNARYCVV
jgi:hypothetical protein